MAARFNPYAPASRGRAAARTDRDQGPIVHPTRLVVVGNLDHEIFYGFDYDTVICGTSDRSQALSALQNLNTDKQDSEHGLKPDSEVWYLGPASTANPVENWTVKVSGLRELFRVLQSYMPGGMSPARGRHVDACTELRLELGNGTLGPRMLEDIVMHSRRWRNCQMVVHIGNADLDDRVTQEHINRINGLANVSLQIGAGGFDPQVQPDYIADLRAAYAAVAATATATVAATAAAADHDALAFLDDL